MNFLPLQLNYLAYFYHKNNCLYLDFEYKGHSLRTGIQICHYLKCFDFI